MMSRGCLLRLRKLRIEQRLHNPTEILAETTRTFPEHFTTHRVHTRICTYVYMHARAYVCVCMCVLGITNVLQIVLRNV